MKHTHNRTFAVLFAILLSFSTLAILNVKAQVEDDIENMILTFLGEVVQIDITQYDASFSSFDTTNWIANLTTITGKYTLVSTGFESSDSSLITGTFTIVDNELVRCSSAYTQNPPIFKEQSEGSVESAIQFLQKYQAFTDDEEVLEMLNILETVNPKTNTTIIVENIKLEADYKSNDVSFCWSKHFSGADFSRLRVNFRGGKFESFKDDRGYIKVGSTQVNISEDQAKAFALSQASAYSFECENGTVLELSFAEEFIKAELKVGPRYSIGEYYPLWTVDVPLDRYYGQFSYFTIIFWADNGEVEDVIPLGGGVYLFVDPEQILKGSLIKTSNPSPYWDPTPTPTPTPTVEPTPTPTEEPQILEQDMTTGAVFAVTSIIIFLSLFIYFIRRT